MARAWASVRSSVRDLAARLLLYAGVTRPDRSAAGRLTVVALHRVLPGEAIAEYPLPQIAITAEELSFFAGLLAEHFTCATLSEAHRRWSGGDRPARPLLALTFDDGQVDNCVHARPVLERAGVPGTFFVPVEAVERDQPLWHDRLGFALRRLAARDRAAALRALAAAGIPHRDDGDVAGRAVARAKSLSEAARGELVERIEREAGGGGRPPWDGVMSWEQLRALAGAGHEVGSHTLTHPLLTRVGAEQLEREVAGSKRRIEAALGVPCDAFCYPNGDCDERVVSAVRRAGYRLAVCSAWGPNARGADPLRLARVELQGRTARDAAGRLSAPRVALRLSPLFARLRR